MSDRRKYDAGSKSVTNASIATTRVAGSRLRLGPAPAWVAVVGEEPPHAASRLPADPIATAPAAVPAAPRMNCRRVYRPSELVMFPALPERVHQRKPRERGDSPRGAYRPLG